LTDLTPKDGDSVKTLPKNSWSDEKGSKIRQLIVTENCCHHMSDFKAFWLPEVIFKDKQFDNLNDTQFVILHAEIVYAWINPVW